MRKVTIRLEPEIYDRLCAQAAANSLSPGAYARQRLSAVIDGQEQVFHFRGTDQFWDVALEAIASAFVMKASMSQEDYDAQQKVAKALRDEVEIIHEY